MINTNKTVQVADAGIHFHISKNSASLIIFLCQMINWYIFDISIRKWQWFHWDEKQKPNLKWNIYRQETMISFRLWLQSYIHRNIYRTNQVFYSQGINTEKIPPRQSLSIYYKNHSAENLRIMVEGFYSSGTLSRHGTEKLKRWLIYAKLRV